jgi:O-antigen/teichoic acid export membrane protein
MFLMMAIGLYTSRVVLNALGVSDYGLNNAVGGAVSLFTFLNGALAQGTQRYLNFSLGTGIIEESKKVFSTAMINHVIFAIFIVILTEVVGLYLLKHKMTIDPNRMDAALVVFHLAVVGLAIGIMMAPVNGCIIAHERMSFYAYTSILDVIFKLLIVFLLLYIDNVDKLILYVVFYFIVGQIYTVINLVYCYRNFEECHFSPRFFDKKLQRDMLSFSGWSIWGNMAALGAGQGVNILLNIFYNTTINAARGIASSASGHIQSFITNFQIAANPQIVKLYASGDPSAMFRLANNTSKYSAFLFIFLAIPIFLEIDYILYIWLGIVPDYTPYFAQVTIIQSLIICMDRPHVTAIHATGKIKWLHIIVGGVLLLIVPITYVMLKMHVSLEIIYAVNVIPWAIGSVIRLQLLKHYIHIDPMDAYKGIYLKVFILLVVCFIPPFIIHCYMDYGLSRLLAVTGISLAWTGSIVYRFGLPKHIREMLIHKIFGVFSRKDHD